VLKYFIWARAAKSGSSQERGERGQEFHHFPGEILRISQQYNTFIISITRNETHIVISFKDEFENMKFPRRDAEKNLLQVLGIVLIR
jgi:hypothetical protein